LEWESLPGVSHYELDIEGNEGNLPPTKTESNSWKGELGTGPYFYKVRAVDSLGRGGDWSPRYFLVVKPDPPKPLEPAMDSELTLTPGQDKVSLKWEGSTEKYEVEVDQGTKSISKTVVNSPTFDAQKLPPGKYHWKVRALIEPSLAIAKQTKEKNWASEFGPELTFTVSAPPKPSPTPIAKKENPDSKKVETKPFGVIRFFSMYSPYSSDIQSSESGYQESVNAGATTFGLGGEYWFRSNWAVSGEATFRFFEINSQAVHQIDFDLLLKRSFSLGSGLGLSILPQAGFGSRQFFSATPSSAQLGSTPATWQLGDISSLGPTAGLEMKKDFFARYDGVLGLGIFFPLTLMGATSGEILNSHSPNLDLWLKFNYWKSKSLGFGVGGLLENRSLQYGPTGSVDNVSLRVYSVLFSALFRLGSQD
jgi:hypothetical protein